MLRRPRETAAASTPALSFAGWRLDLVRRELTSPENVLIALSDGEFSLLRVFVECLEAAIRAARPGGMLDIEHRQMGPRALEIEDMYIRLDQELARLLNALDQAVGAGRYTLFLTADHGAVDVPQYLKDLKGSAGYVDVKELQRQANALAAAAVFNGGQGDAVDTLFDGNIFLKDDRMNVNAVDIAAGLERLPIISRAIPVRQLRNVPSGDVERTLLANGIMPERSGDIVYTLKPGYFEAEGIYAGKGTTHGSGWTYDTHVPVLLFGQGIAQGEVVRRTAVADIVPTVCMVVGCALPDAAVGEPVREALKP